MIKNKNEKFHAITVEDQRDNSKDFTFKLSIHIICQVI